MSAQSHAEFPDAEYLILSSRLIPDRDGGYALATLARARQMAAGGVHDGLGPLLLTLDPGTPGELLRRRPDVRAAEHHDPAVPRPHGADRGSRGLPRASNGPHRQAVDLKDRRSTSNQHI